MNGLLLTLGLGLFIIVGAMIVFITKNNERFISFSIASAFGVMSALIGIDLVPSALETGQNLSESIFYMMIGLTAGFLILKILDHFIPDHEDDHKTEEDDDKNLKHIGLVSSIALVMHNIVEGMAIYSLFINDWKCGLIASLGVGLHNIPLGMVIASTFYQSNKNKKKTSFIIVGISLSTFIGGLIIYLFQSHEIMEMIELVSLPVTIGMLLYISLMELLPKIIHSKYHKSNIIGILLGISLLLLTLFIPHHHH
ncbi:MAG: ZIP family metal transporter [bacterium]|nr:ZIP family metal transporter [bacterium]